MGKLVGRSLFVEGYFVRFTYVSLYKMHETGKADVRLRRRDFPV